MTFYILVVKTSSILKSIPEFIDLDKMLVFNKIQLLKKVNQNEFQGLISLKNS